MKRKSKQIRRLPANKLEKVRDDFKKFLKSLGQKKLLAVGLGVAELLFLLLPSPGYYQTLHLFWQPKEAEKIDIQVPLHSYPVNKTKKEPPVISARSIVVMDVNSSVVISQRNSDLTLLPASTTKIMTALIVLENYQLDQVLTVGNLEENGQKIKLLPGEKMTVENLLYGLLVASGNDAAQVLAQNFTGGELSFVEAMNQKARELNLNDTHFENPTGIDHPNHYSTALDLARLSSTVLRNPVFAKMVATERITIWDVNKAIPHQLFNINQLVSKNLGVKGIKTGWTEEAGECLVAYVEKNGQRIISVILGSQNRFGETEKLIRWVYENFEWEEMKISNF